MRQGCRVAALASLWLALSAAPQAHAWGDEGHRIVALLAQQYLTPRAQARIQAILAQDRSGLTDDTSLASEATWADHYRDSDRDGARQRYQRTWHWHFVDLELQDPDLVRACFGEPRLPRGLPASAGPARDCIVDKIDEFQTELASSQTPPAEQLLALQFLLHLVGDLHQPLHAADDRDSGGNRVHVSAPGERAGSLHHYWDSVFVAQLGDSAPAIAYALRQHIGPRELNVWRAGRAEDWSVEAFGLARRVAYGELPNPGTRARYRLSASYMRDSRAVVALQLSRAGVRLAWLLNRALDGDGRYNAGPGRQ